MATVKALTGTATPSWMLMLAPVMGLFQRSSAVSPKEVHEVLTVDMWLAAYNAYDAALPESRHTLGS